MTSEGHSDYYFKTFPYLYSLVRGFEFWKLSPLQRLKLKLKERNFIDFTPNPRWSDKSVMEEAYTHVEDMFSDMCQHLDVVSAIIRYTQTSCEYLEISQY